ncbi:hypothetical protein KQI08_12185 [Paraeggerthella hongkongensis]|nr:hypothetical protein [Paraeggerthella hongkongensis]MBU5406655.1 hypothetical protein [Paraeggerthella hongkongensis]
MKIKLIKELKIDRIRSVRTGEEHTVRHLPSDSFIAINRPFQIIEGEHSGIIVPREYCILVEEQKKYSEREWNDMENEYMAALDKETREKERAQQIVRELTAQINNKNKEIEKLTFFLNCSSLALRASCQAIETLKGNR